MRVRFIFVAALAALALAACSSDSTETPQADEGQNQSTPSTAAADSGQPEGNDAASQGLPQGGDGTYVVDGESFDATVYRCEPFTSPGNEPDDRDLSTLGFRGGSEGLEVEIGYATGIDQGQQYDRQILFVFHSRSGTDGLEQFEGAASQDAAGAWYPGNELIFDGLTALDAEPFSLDGNRLTGGPLTLVESWPNEGASTVVVESWDFTIPDDVWSEC